MEGIQSRSSEFHPWRRVRAIRIVGGELRNSRRPSAVAERKHLVKMCRASSGLEYGPSNENTNLNGLTWLSSRNPSHSTITRGIRKAELVSRVITSSENTGDVIVEKASMTRVLRRTPRRRLTNHSSTCKDRRALRPDKLGNERGRTPVHRQLKSADGSTQNSLSVVSNRTVSRVSAHASSRVGVQLPPQHSSIYRNRRPPHKVIRCVQVSAQPTSPSSSHPRSFGAENGTSSVSGIVLSGMYV